MIGAFYNSRGGLWSHNKAMEVISNNFANVNTTGFKGDRATFSDILYTNVNLPADQMDPVRTGNGSKVSQVATLHQKGSFLMSNGEYDYAINGEGFFAVQNQLTGDVRYTRDGSFRKMVTDEGIYLVTGNGDYVLDGDMQSILLDETTMGEQHSRPNIGVFTFANTQGLMKAGDNLFMETDGSLPPVHDPLAELVEGYLEHSNVDMSNEMSKVIETQRAFQINSRIMQMSDELDQIINNLR